MFAHLLVLFAVLCVAVAGVRTGESDKTINSFLWTPEYAEALSLRLQPREEHVPMAAPRPLVKLPDGTRLQGVTIENSTVNAFKGIRFAQAPLGTLRFAPPKKYANPNPGGIVDAGRYGASCVQGFPLSMIGEEDCLFLNVWTPADATSKSALPVGTYVCIPIINVLSLV
jgi:hypothetical protein